MYLQNLTSRWLLQVGRNICHGSDAVESAEKEIALWFKPEELVSWEANQAPWVYE
jgi:nucleoside-diphosphate kinase